MGKVNNDISVITPKNLLWRRNSRAAHRRRRLVPPAFVDRRKLFPRVPLFQNRPDRARRIVRIGTDPENRIRRIAQRAQALLRPPSFEDRLGPLVAGLDELVVGADGRTLLQDGPDLLALAGEVLQTSLAAAVLAVTLLAQDRRESRSAD